MVRDIWHVMDSVAYHTLVVLAGMDFKMEVQALWYVAMGHDVLMRIVDYMCVAVD